MSNTLQELLFVINNYKKINDYINANLNGEFNRTNNIHLLLEMYHTAINEMRKSIGLLMENPISFYYEINAYLNYNYAKNKENELQLKKAIALCDKFDELLPDNPRKIQYIDVIKKSPLLKRLLGQMYRKTLPDLDSFASGKTVEEIRIHVNENQKNLDQLLESNAIEYKEYQFLYKGMICISEYRISVISGEQRELDQILKSIQVSSQVSEQEQKLNKTI